jgi:hypothetical protein
MDSMQGMPALRSRKGTPNMAQSVGSHSAACEGSEGADGRSNTMCRSDQFLEFIESAATSVLGDC